MKYRPFTEQGPAVSAIGLGTWGMSGDYGPAVEDESVATIERALAIGINHIDTADMYGWGHNEELVGRAIAGRRDDVFLGTKFGYVQSGARMTTTLCGRPEYVRQAIDASLQRLRTDHVDVYYLHRVDPNTPVEESFSAMAELVQLGKARYLGLCEVSGSTIRRAHAVHPVAVVQSEYSLWWREPENEVLPVIRELGIAFIPFSPLGRGFLAGQVRTRDDLMDGDIRAQLPRFSDNNLRQNRHLAEALQQLADEKQTTPAALALAWLLAQGERIFPIPGMRRRAHVDANASSADLILTHEDIERIEGVFPHGAAAGDRYPPQLMQLVDQEAVK